MAFSIETKRLLLRDFQESDWEPFIQHFKDPLVQDGILSFQSHDQQIHRQFERGLLSAKQNPRLAFILTVVRKDTGEVIGNCDISGTLNGYTQTCIGWHYGSACRGNGYATEAALELLRLGFQDHNVDRIFAECFVNNIASIRVMEKIGMTQHRNGFLARWARGARYGEQRPIMRHQILKRHWLLKQNGNEKVTIERMVAEQMQGIEIP